MDDENGLELSLGLSLGGGSSGKSKAPLEPKTEPQVEESSSKGGSQTPDAPFGKYYQKNADNEEHNSKKSHSPAAPSLGKFWGQPGGSSTPVKEGSIEPASHQSQLPRYQDGRISNKCGNNSEEHKPITSNHKLPSEESFQKKHPTAVDQPDAFSKSSDGGAKNAPISISTDDGSTGENEDVAESEAEGSNSWLVAQREDSAKGSVVNKGSDRKRSADDTAVGFQGKRQPSFSGSESSSGKLPLGNPMSMQASSVVAVPYQVPPQVSGPPTITNTPPNFHTVCTVQLRPPTNGGPTIHTTGGSSFAFGYPAVQLPTLETSSSWAFGAPLQAQSSFTVKDRAEQTGTKQADDGKKPQDAGASSATRAEDEKKADRAFPLMGSAIRPGIAPNVKFGGCGSYPDLPWVSTTGAGPHGRTISGVTYKFGRNEVKVVCSCHGTHMSPEEFMRHANADPSSQDLPPFSAGPAEN
ncbi:hypothetical protein EJB05_36551 [Eragrostis curvula]|uniref:Ninja-family protein n=1 Tax=Eragrostis curvula TaxID=38414 RepID=A0A5J9SNP0_9POAL|nr:hypothetical protein EJB05_54010 [Eragrostis curvula]TVU20346.1 hypothetical protein EJB05_36551 [Eragrostis curvula]